MLEVAKREAAAKYGVVTASKIIGELVVNRETKEPFSPEVMGEVKKTLMDNGLFTFIMVKDIGTMVFIVPPLCITQDQLDEGLELVEKALEVADAKVK